MTDSVAEAEPSSGAALPLGGRSLAGQLVAGQPRQPARARSGARHRRPPQRRPILRPVGIALIACGVLATALGLSGWVLANQGQRAHLVRHGSQMGHPPPGSVGVGLAAGPFGPIGRITGSFKRFKHTTVAKPAWLVIPAIGVSTPLVRLGLTAQNTLQVPPTAVVAGWYSGSPRPGQIGSAIIAGHIDSRLGPGVFYHLGQLRRSQYIYVILANHTVAVFQVTGLRTYVKSNFPRNAIYGPVPDAELRLITCGGTFDYATGTYLSNVVVYAVLIR